MKKAAGAFLLLSTATIVNAQTCPELDCAQEDRVFLIRESCFWARSDNEGKISKIHIGSCGTKDVCNIKSNEFVWVNSNLQLLQLKGNDFNNVSLSQFYYKKAEGKCIAAADSIKAMKNSGR